MFGTILDAVSSVFVCASSSRHSELTPHSRSERVESSFLEELIHSKLRLFLTLQNEALEASSFQRANQLLLLKNRSQDKALSDGSAINPLEPLKPLVLPFRVKLEK